MNLLPSRAFEPVIHRFIGFVLMKAALVLFAACTLCCALYLFLGQESDVAPLAAAHLDSHLEADPTHARAPSTPEAQHLPLARARATAASRTSGQATTVDPTPTEVLVKVVGGLGDPLVLAKPLPEIHVILHAINDREQVFDSGVTGSDGSVILSAPRGLLHINEHGETKVTARVRHSGFMPSPGTVRRLQREGPEAFGVRLSTSKGWIQRVQIEGEIEGHVHSEVAIRRAVKRSRGSNGARRLGRGLTTDSNSHLRSLGDGAFELRLKDSEDERWLVVDGGRNGRASWKIAKPEAPKTEAEPVRLRLEGPAKLVGRVMDARGEPAPKVSLKATLIPSGAANGESALHEPFMTDLIKRGEGQFVQRAVTDHEGRYSFVGLLNGRFRIDAFHQFRAELQNYEPTNLGHQLASIDPDPAELVFTRPIIVVAVNPGPEKVPCDIVLFDAGAAGALPWARSGRNAMGLPTAAKYAGSRVPAHADPEDWTSVLEVQEGRQYFLVARGEGYDPTPQLVQVPSDGAPAHAAVGPPGETAMGTLKIQLTLGEIELPEGLDDWVAKYASYGVFVQDIQSAIPLGALEPRAFDDGPAELLVPAGTVRVVAVGRPSHMPEHWTLICPRLDGRTERVVNVKPGAVTSVNLDLTCNGGYLEVTLKGETTATEKASLEAEVARMDEYYGFLSEETRSQTLSGTLHLENLSERIHLPVTRTALDMTVIGGGEQTLTEWLLGETHISDVLPPGSYTLHATFPGRAPIQIGVTITDDETTKVELDLDA